MSSAFALCKKHFLPNSLKPLGASQFQFYIFLLDPHLFSILKRTYKDTSHDCSVALKKNGATEMLNLIAPK